ncbi:MAG TPA: S8 family peptidase [Hyphomicrobium sp.]|nr:S8 family peptidase [Hyphomicrobium sp.]
MTADAPGAATLQEVEDFRAFTGPAKLRSIPTGDDVLLEVALHSLGIEDTIDAFAAYARKLRATVLEDHLIEARGLIFVPVRISSERVQALADFSFVRVARGMPELRPYRPSIVRSGHDFPASLGSLEIQTNSTRAVIFDGGIPVDARRKLAPAVTLIDPPGIGDPVPSLELHGLAVTSAFLFGSLSENEKSPPPLCAVDHVRVLDKRSGAQKDLMYLDVLKRIVDFLDENANAYQFINISLGPDLPIEDDEVTAWTALLDERFATGHWFATIAAGNSGERDRASQLCRIQPPSDGVNVLAVGACDRSDAGWNRASYSSMGPGRTPGRVKPDGLSFGGSEDEPFNALVTAKKATGLQGTSFAAPLTLRTAAAVSVSLGQEVSLLALRALVIHTAQPHATADQTEVGWGRFEQDPQRLVTCEDDEAVVLYQGDLPVSEHLRCFLPMPDAELTGDVIVSATLVISSEVDPNNPSTYTRSGLEVFFRPHSQKFRKVKPGETKPKHQKTKSFFSLSNLYGASEGSLRDGAHKWEPCLRRSQLFRSASLNGPLFDVYYHTREGGAAVKTPKPIRYALVVGIKAPKVKDFYNRVVRSYAGVLVPLKTEVRVRIR